MLIQERSTKPGNKSSPVFMLSLALLVSVIILILIVETLGSLLLREFIEDKPIITIIILLAGVSLLSFLIQRYMNKKPKEVARIWKIVARFLLLPALLISVLILIVETWYPVLGFIKDNQIIAIITLLTSVSLLSFLLQRYMNKKPEDVAKIWKIVAYPVHWAFRLVARSVLLLAILLTIMLTLIMTPIFLYDIFCLSSRFPPSHRLAPAVAHDTGDYSNIIPNSNITPTPNFHMYWHMESRAIRISLDIHQ